VGTHAAGPGHLQVHRQAVEAIVQAACEEVGLAPGDQALGVPAGEVAVEVGAPPAGQRRVGVEGEIPGDGALDTGRPGPGVEALAGAAEDRLAGLPIELEESSLV